MVGNGGPRLGLKSGPVFSYILGFPMRGALHVGRACVWARLNDSVQFGSCRRPVFHCPLAQTAADRFGHRADCQGFSLNVSSQSEGDGDGAPLTRPASSTDFQQSQIAIASPYKSAMPRSTLRPWRSCLLNGRWALRLARPAGRCGIRRIELYKWRSSINCATIAPHP